MGRNFRLGPMADRAEGDPDPNECQQRAALSARQIPDHFKAIPKLPKSGIAGEGVPLPERRVR